MEVIVIEQNGAVVGCGQTRICWDFCLKGPPTLAVVRRMDYRKVLLFPAAAVTKHHARGQKRLPASTGGWKPEIGVSRVGFFLRFKGGPAPGLCPGLWGVCQSLASLALAALLQSLLLSSPTFLLCVCVCPCGHPGGKPQVCR